MLITCTLKDGIVYVPTIVKTEAGFYMRREPVAVVPAANTDALWRAFQDVMAKGNEIVPTPKRDAYPPPVLPKYAGAKNWSAFMKGAFEWAINEDNGNYEVVPYHKDPEGSQAWVADKERKTQFPVGTARNEVIEQMIKIIQTTASTR
ncbi:hypothetical protein SAMN05414138_1037 [Rhodoplanes sp. JGI PP 4-B12]|uniref:hypothetical protein n=1 Tax=Rhodoplanes sp. JGI PP 4-B12 TaxID=1873883 RepID=UPI000B50C323|nr:hypothetical protein [Rhodoplanes sp. JGI PP 4-B12]SNB54822.1 hypothetical protein SAMN05414138_1037 [Rhodoplanes sp. JGI PP 4-B12]